MEEEDAGVVPLTCGVDGTLVNFHPPAGFEGRGVDVEGAEEEG